MKKIKVLLSLVLCLFVLLPNNTYAIGKDYNDLVYKIVDKEISNDKINVYLFYSYTCPHCEKERKFFDSIKEKYKNVNFYEFEVIKDKDNYNNMVNVKTLFKQSSGGVPYTVIGDREFLGYNDFVGEKIEKTIQEFLEEDNVTENEKNTFKLPVLGSINAKNISIPVVAIVLGLIDGFNPCAMWVLLLLINMFFRMKNKKRMLLYGYTFLFTSALVYFLSMLGISFILGATTIRWIKILIALVALIAGVLNIRTYIKTRNDDGCHVVDEKKRKNIISKSKKIISEDKIIVALLGIVALAISVNLVELACSLGFPAIFSEILAINKINGLSRVLYLLLYVLFYMIDDIIVFTIAVCTLSLSTKSTKWTKYVNLIAGVIMILIGVLLIFKPEWIMFNF